MTEAEVDAYLNEPISLGQLMSSFTEQGGPDQDRGKPMPAEKAKSVLASRAKLFNKAIKSHAQDETTYGLVKLPGGINNGIAQLQDIEFAEHKEGNLAGQPYFRAVGIVHEPNKLATPDGLQKVAGLQTSIFIPLYDKKDSNGKVTTADDQWKKVLNELRRLGGEDFTADAETVEDIEELCEQLVEAKPFFRFTTELSKPQIDPKTKKPKVNPKTGKPYEPMVFENWCGALDDYEPVDASSNGMVDEDESTVTSRKAKSRKAEEEGEEEEEEFVDGAELPEEEEEVEDEASEEEEEESKEEEEATDEDEGGEEEEDEEEDEEPPIKGDVVMFKPLDPKTKKPVKKPVECEVMAVDKKSKTVTLKNLDTKKLVQGVPWSKLE